MLGDLLDPTRRRSLDDRHVARAAPPAADLVAELTAGAADLPGIDLENALCGGIALILEPPKRKDLAPDHVLKALITASADAVRDALARGDDWTAAWRVFITVAGIATAPFTDDIESAVRELREPRGVAGLPPLPSGPALAGEARWVRDRYGSRIGVLAPFTAEPGAPARWYLWDIDGCGDQVATVHSGYYSTETAALAEWRRGVGAIAAGDADWSPIDEPGTLAKALPRLTGFMDVSAESAAQLIEYHRSRRLTAVILAGLDTSRTAGDGLDAERAAIEFATWLTARRPDEVPDDLEELARELADSWLTEAPSLYGCFSPHRVALTVLHLRNYYLDDFAETLVELLPDWITWLAERSGAAPELRDRSLAYAGGKPHPDIDMIGVNPDSQARIIE
jgi:hypothetical protein